MSDTSIESRIAALEGRVADLERQRWEGPPRLGPRPPSAEEVAKRTEDFVESVKAKVDEARAKHEHEQDELGRQICTTSGEAPTAVRSKQRAEGNTGQHSSYIVLCEEERRKGFVRPYRDAYKHVGRLLELPPSIPAHEGDSKETAKVRTGGCGTVTTMGRTLSETYARDPKFYGATFCCGCNAHFPVAEFVWTADGQEVGS